METYSKTIDEGFQVLSKRIDALGQRIPLAIANPVVPINNAVISPVSYDRYSPGHTPPIFEDRPVLPLFDINCAFDAGWVAAAAQPKSDHHTFKKD